MEIATTTIPVSEAQFLLVGYVFLFIFSAYFGYFIFKQK